MTDHSFFIRRPYLAVVIAIVTVLCGAIALFQLPVAQYPNVTPPQVSITTSYPGADAETLLNTVIEPIETQVNGVRDMIYMSSNASNDGTVNFVVTFRIGTDGENNTKNVQSRVNWALSQLPQSVQQQGVIVREQSGNILLAIAIDSENGMYDPLFLSNYASINIVDDLSRLPGVSQVQLFGASDYAIRFWLKPEKMASMNMSASEVLSAIRSQNLQVSAGAIGSAPSPKGQNSYYAVNLLGRLTTVPEFQSIVVRSLPDGAQVRISDVAEVELGASTYQLSGFLNGKGAVVLLVYQRNDANAIEISNAVRAKLQDLSARFPDGVSYGIKYDATEFIRVSVRDVVSTLVLAVILVALVVYLFLQNWRMALVPVLAIPVSVVGTFAILMALGFSINLVTLFGLILAIGIVVDDAIIVIENVSRLITTEHLSPKKAAEKSMRQITGAIIATTAVLLAMFLPICFLSGITGELYRQFGVTLCIALTLSAVNALSLSPALSAVLLKPGGEGTENFCLFRWFNAGFRQMKRLYLTALKHTFRYALLMLILFGAFTAGMVFWYQKIPTGFIPQEDQGVFFIMLQMPSNTPLARTEETAGKAAGLLRTIPGVRDILTMSGFNILTRNSVSGNAFILITLEDWDSRLKNGQTIDRIMGEANRRLLGVTEGFFASFQPPPIPGIGTAGGFDFVLQTLSGNDTDALKKYLYEMIGAAMQSGKLRNIFTAWNPASSAVYLDVDREKALRMGVALTDFYQVLESTLGFLYINDFNRFGQVYKVEVQGVEQARSVTRRIRELYVRNNRGEMVPLASFLRLSTQIVPENLNRYNMRLSATIQGEPGPGISSAQAMEEMEAIAKRVLPAEMQYEWSNMSYQEDRTGTQAFVIFTLALVFIFLFLAALYESWMLPLSVICCVPFVFPGAFALLRLDSLDNNLYTHVGLVLLFGLACKTSILLVDFAEKNHQAEGRSILRASLAAANLRFRAILMTAFTFICGTLPLMLATGPGASSQRSIGCAVVGGMTTAVVLILLLSPLFYAVCQRLADLRRGRQGENEAEDEFFTEKKQFSD